jgi:hypothetical protein
LTLSPDIATNEVATATRWQKLYRTIFNLFLKRDFVHKQDYLTDIAALNANIKLLETAINTHVHPSPQAPAGTLVTLPQVSPIVIPPVQHVDAVLEQQNATQLATGPSVAPLGQGISPEVQKARIEVREDIGLA